MRKRSLSEFMCIEMLYDYKTGRLDPLRTQAVEEGIQSSPRVREELKKLSQGILYCEKLKNIKVSEPLVELISSQPRVSEKILQKFSWGGLPQPIRWVIEGGIVVLAIGLFVTQQDKLFKSGTVLDQPVVYKKYDVPENEVDKLKTNIAENQNITSPEPSKLQKITEGIQSDSIPLEVVPEKPLLLARTALETQPEKTTNENINKQSEVEASSSAGIEESKNKKGNLYVYRMSMYVDDVDKVTPEIVRLVESLGGIKAGEVELGWRRKGGSYFHFSMPQDNNNKLQEGLRKIANFNIVKSPHPRVMPAGTERFILWVEAKQQGSQQNNPPNEEQNSGTQGAE